MQQSVATPRSKSCQARYVVRAASCMLAVLLYGSAGAHAKRLVAFGDSITDNGNGTRVYVQLWYAELLKRTEPFNVVSPAVTNLPACSYIHLHWLPLLEYICIYRPTCCELLVVGCEQGYPPPPAYWDLRWSNGPTWIGLTVSIYLYHTSTGATSYSLGINVRCVPTQSIWYLIW